MASVLSIRRPIAALAARTAKTTSQKAIPPRRRNGPFILNGQPPKLFHSAEASNRKARARIEQYQTASLTSTADHPPH